MKLVYATAAALLGLLVCAFPASAAETITPQPAATSTTPDPQADARRQELNIAINNLVVHGYNLIESGKPRTAFAEAMQARGQLGKDRDIRIETLLGRIAIVEKVPEKALEFVDPYTADRKKYDPDIGLVSVVAGDAYLALNKNQQALEVFDWVAGKAEGKTMVMAAEGCGKAFMAMKEHAKALDSFDFALRYAREKDTASDPFTALIKRIQPLADKARRLADIDLYGEDFVLYRDAERLRRLEKKFKEARPIYQDILKRFPDGPYAEPSQLYGAECLVEMGQETLAEKELAALRQANPHGLYSGEAILQMGRLALEYHLEPTVARGCFALLDTWLTEVKAAPTVLNVEKLSHLKTGSEKVIAPPKAEKYVDFWGNVKKSEIKPGMLVNPKTCTWYLDDLTEQSAMYQGFLYFVEGKKEEALAQYRRILDCDPQTKLLDASGEWNDFSRLKFGADNGYLYAYPQELSLYKNPRQKMCVLLADFYYVTQQFDRAQGMAQRLLNGLAGELVGTSREYPQLLYAASTYRAGDVDKALKEYLKVLAGRHGQFSTYTEYRAAFAASNLAYTSTDPAMRRSARELEVALVGSPQQNEETYKARINMACELVKEGHREDGLRLLREFPGDAGPYKKIADHYLKVLDQPL